MIAPQELRRLQEKVAVLTGERGDKSRSAVTQGDVAELRRVLAGAVNDIAAIKAHLGL